MELDKLRQAGFSDQEIQDHVSKKSQSLLSAGFNEKEVNEYFGVKEVDKNPITQYWRDIKTGVKETLVGKEFDPDLYYERGLGSTIFSLMGSYNNGGGLPDVFNTPEPEDTGYLEGFIERGTTLLGDLPFYTLGAMGGGYVGGKYGASFGAGFVPGSVRAMYIDALEKGQTNSWSDWWKSFIEVGMKEGAIEGAQLTAAVAAPGFIGPLGKNYFGKVGSQFLAFETVGAALTGEMPTKDDLIYSAGFFAAFGAGERAVRKYRNQSKETGKKPAEVYEDSIIDPKIREDIVSKNIDVARSYENLVEKPKKPEVKAEEIKPEKSIDPDIAKVQEKISSEPITKKFELKEFKDNLTFGWLDKLNPILRTVREGQKLGVKVEEGSLNPYEIARIQPGMISRGQHMIDFGVLDYKTLDNISKPLKDIIEPVTKDVKVYEEFKAYAVAKRSIEKESQKLKTGIDQTAAKNTVKKLDPKYKSLLNDLNIYQDKVLKYLVDSGVITKDLYNVIREANKDYVPFFRVMEEGAKDGAISKTVSNPIKQFKGSERSIADPVESIYKNTIHFTTLAERNRSLVELIKFVEKAKQISPESFPEVSQVKPKLKRVTVTRKELENVVTDVTKIKESALEGFEIFRKGSEQLGKNEVAIFRNGKREVWDLGPDLSRSYKYINQFSEKYLQGLVSLPAKTLRAGATLAPEFFIRNIIRDTVTSGIYSRSGFIFGLDTIRGLGIRIAGKKSKMYQDWVKSGGPQSSYVAMDRNYFSKNIKNELTKQSPVRNIVTKPLEMLRIATEFFENSTRLGEFRKSYLADIKKGYTHKQAVERGGYNSRDITIDFQKMGAQVQGWNQIAAFFNARLQGYVKFYDALENPKTRMSALRNIGLSITLPSALLWWVNHDDERYKELPRWQKDLFWIIITGDEKDYTVWRIPKPFELGLLFGTGAERFLDFAAGTKDYEAIKKFFGNVAYDNLSQLVPIPDIIKPAIETFANKSLFTKKPIVPRNLEGLLPELQYTEYTSETSKVLGRIIRQISGEYSGVSSPVQIDNVINGWTGTLGRTFVSVLDKALILGGIVDDPIKPDYVLSDIPIIRAFVVRQPTGGSEYITEFYEKYNKIEKKFNTADKLQAQGKIEEAQRIRDSIPPEQFGFKATNSLLTNLRKHIRNIYNAKLFSPQEKREYIDELYRNMIDISRQSLEIAKQGKKD